MTPSNSNNGRKKISDERLTSLLKKSPASFKFNQKRIKESLLGQIEEQQLNKAAELIKERTKVSFLKRHRLATAFGTAILVAAGSGAALSQAGIYQPASTINALGHVQEEVMLKLPLPAAQKADIQMRVAENRARKLEQALEQSESPHTRTEALHESSEIMSQAIDQISGSKQKQVERGRSEAADKYSTMLERLAELANQQEQKVEELIESGVVTDNNAELNNHLSKIKSLRLKAEAQIELTSTEQ